MRVLVTGGAGFIGSNLVDTLVDRGAEVVVLDDISTGFRENLHPAATLVEADIADREAVARAVAGCEVVFHQAAHRAVFRSVEHPIETDRANVGGTLTVLQAAREAGVRRVVRGLVVVGVRGRRDRAHTRVGAARAPVALRGQQAGR